ncbi:MAG: AMP-binding protein, partial [Treponema sp.]|nr:AMP-binding protein [Treponema sp.]
MDLLDKYVPRKDFSSYEDFYDNFTVNVPENFNFAWDVMDELAASKGNERAMFWCDEKGAEASFTYTDIKTLSNQAAHTFKTAGIGKGDPVMLILKRRWEYWPALLALHKLGAIAIPATHLLTSKDIAYRCKAADIAGIVCVDDAKIMDAVDEAEITLRAEGVSTLRYKAFMRGVHSGAQPGGAAWTDFKSLMEKADAEFARPSG